MIDDDEAEGEMMEFDDAEPDVIDTEDGGAIIRFEDDDAEGYGDFYANLAESMPESEMARMASTLVELVGHDKTARSKRDEQYEDGLRRTGLGDDAPGGAQFEGASKVVHPMLTEACVDFAARAIKELFPAGGPAKEHIPGEITTAKIKKAQRKTRLLNWQLTKQSREFRSELEQMLTQVPLGGAQYLKARWDERRNAPRFLFVAIDDMLVPFSATSFITAQRKTHVQYLTRQEYEKRIADGMYRDVDIIPTGIEPERSAADVANDKIEGRSPTAYNEDGLRTVLEIHLTYDVEDKGALPYIVTIDKSTNKVLAIYRNWDEQDEAQEELQWFVEFPFVPWRGAYPIGLPHMIGGLSAAATGALRALLDSAHIQNTAGMLKLKGGTKGGQTARVQPTEVVEIEAGLNVDDIRKVAMPLPFNPPSPVLFQLLGSLIDMARGVVRTTFDDAPDMAGNAPVGTTLARIEQGLVVYSAIHGRLHAAMQQVLLILHRLNAMYLDDERLEHEAGEELATRADFEGPMDVVPVSDPNIFSETQRFAQVQAVAQRAAALPQLYNLRKVEERILDTLKIPNAEDLLNPPVEPREQNAVNENVAAALGRPVVAFPEQDHVAHIQTHLAFIQSPLFGGNPLVAPALLPAMVGHLKEHLVLWYAAQAFEVGTETTGEDIGEAIKQNKGAAEKRAFDRLLSEISTDVITQGQQMMAQLPQILAQLMQAAQQYQQPAPMDPVMAETQRKAQADQAKAQIEQARLQQAAQNDQQRLQIEQAKLQQDAQVDQARLALDAQAQQSEDQRAAAEIAARQAMNTQDNMTAVQLAQMEVASGERVAVSTGTGINPGPR